MLPAVRTSLDTETAQRFSRCLDQQYDTCDPKLRFDFGACKSIIMHDFMDAGVSLYGDIKEHKEKLEGKRAAKLLKS